MTYSVPPPAKVSIREEIEAMKPETDKHFPNATPGTIKVIVSRVRKKFGKARAYMTAKTDEGGARVWRTK